MEDSKFCLFPWKLCLHFIFQLLSVLRSPSNQSHLRCQVLDIRKKTQDEMSSTIFEAHQQMRFLKQKARGNVGVSKVSTKERTHATIIGKAHVTNTAVKAMDRNRCSASSSHCGMPPHCHDEALAASIRFATGRMALRSMARTSRQPRHRSGQRGTRRVLSVSPNISAVFNTMVHRD